MRTLVDNYINFSRTFVENHKEELANNNISILTDFLDNEFYIREFYKKFVEPNTPKIVLCGINPGRKGAGKTGVSFLDFRSLSKILPELKKDDFPTFGRPTIATIGLLIFFSLSYININLQKHS